MRIVINDNDSDCDRGNSFVSCVVLSWPIRGHDSICSVFSYSTRLDGWWPVLVEHHSDNSSNCNVFKHCVKTRFGDHVRAQTTG